MKRKYILDKTRKGTDDEWYTPRETADRLALWLRTEGRVGLDTPILCPADILPDGTESAIPQALRAAGFAKVRVTRDLPLDPLYADWRDGELVVTNPPFSLLVPLRRWLALSGAKYCLLARPGVLRGWPVPCMTDRFHTLDGRSVAACWMQNLADTGTRPPADKALGDCALCERRACPANDLTGDWRPGRPRRLYGYCFAVKHGFAGNYCRGYIVVGKQTFIRFFERPRTSREAANRQAPDADETEV